MNSIDNQQSTRSSNNSTTNNQSAPHVHSLPPDLIDLVHGTTDDIHLPGNQIITLKETTLCHSVLIWYNAQLVQSFVQWKQQLLIWERRFCENFSAPIHYYHMMYYQPLVTVSQLKEDLNTPSLVPEELEDKHSCDMYCPLAMLIELGSLNRLEHSTVL